MRRRHLLKIGLGAAVLLAVAGGGAALLRPGLIDGRLSPSGRQVLSGVARALLDALLPLDEDARHVALQAQLQRLDTAIAAFPQATRSELSQLLALLASAPGRLAIAGLHTDWTPASVQDIQHALQAMRIAPIRMRQQAYHALRRLTIAAYFADRSTWSTMGYPGPVEI